MGQRRLLLLTDGFLDVFTAKTAVTLLRYCRDDVVAVLDTQYAGRDPVEIVGTGEGVPIVDSVSAALSFEPNHLVIGAAFPGGLLPATWRTTIADALAGGMHVINGLHQTLGDDPELSARAAEHGRFIYDIRQVTRQYPVGAALAARTRAKRILTVGSDCNVGKMLVSLEIARELNARGRKAEFIATGQTGVMVAGRGEVLDAVKSDFVAGAVEALVLEADETSAEFIVVEGQGGLLHPGFSGVTQGLMHGVLPERMVLCHDPARQNMRHTRVRIPPLRQLIELHEAVLEPLFPSKVVAAALNCHGQSAKEAAQSIEKVAQETGLPATDCVRNGAGVVVDALLESLK